jgi:uncharacterized protein (DUF4415 family)
MSTNTNKRSGEKISDNEPWADPDDTPELTEEFFEQADLYYGNKLIRAGRPPSEKLRIDPDIVDYFRATGQGWQTRINDTLRKAIKLIKPKARPGQDVGRDQGRREGPRLELASDEIA